MLSKVIGTLFWMLLAWGVVALTRARSQRVTGRIDQQPLESIGWGALGVFAIAPAAVAVALAAVLLCVTIIGIPVAVLGILGSSLAVVLLLFWGGIVGAAALGGWFVRRLSPRLGEPNLTRNTLVGIVAISGFSLVGYILKPEYFTEGASFPSAKYLTATSVGPRTGPLLMKTLGEIVPQ